MASASVNIQQASLGDDPVRYKFGPTGKESAEVADARSPVIRRRELGALLRALRTEAGKTVEEVAESLLVSPSKISRLETGHRGASPRDIRDLCDFYQVTDPVQRDHLAALAREGRGPAWWQPYDLPYATYVGLEEAAIRISDFEPGVFPGLLQTPDYARALHLGAMPRLSARAIDQRIEVRANRQKILTRAELPRVQLEAIVDEAVLRRVVGSPAIMSAQIARVVETCELPTVIVQVLPFNVGAHPALDSTFIILEFHDPVPGVVYVEGLAGQLYLERPQDVQRYQQVFERLRMISLSQEQSLDLMTNVCHEYQRN